MGIEIWNGSNWANVLNPEIWNGSSWQNIMQGEIWNGSAWQTFYVRLTPVVPTVSNVSAAATSLTFRYQHPGDTETNSPVRIEYRLKNNAGTVVQSGSATFASGSINQTVEFTSLASNATFSFEARAVYTDHNIETDYSNPVSRTTSITTVAPSVFVVNRQPTSLTFRYTHPGDTQTNTPVSITYYLIESSTLQTVRGPTTSTATTGAIDVTLPAYTALASNSGYTFVAQANYPTYGLTSATGTVGTTTLVPPPPPPEYGMLPDTTSFSRGGSVKLDVTTQNVPNGTILYWSAINNNSNDQYNEFVSSQGTVTIQGGAGEFNVVTKFLNLSPGLFNITNAFSAPAGSSIGTTATSLGFRARMTSGGESFRGTATFKVKLYTDSLRTNEVTATSNINIVAEPYNIEVSFSPTVANTTYYLPGPSSFSVTTGELNNIEDTPGLAQFTQYIVTARTRYTSRNPQRISDITQVTRATLRNATNLSRTLSSFSGVRILTMRAIGGAIQGTVGQGGTTECYLEFSLEQKLGQQYFAISTIPGGSITVQRDPNAITATTAPVTATRSRTITVPSAGTYRFLARAVYPSHGNGKITEWQSSGDFNVT
jgi:hypothetical protein